MPLMQCAHRGNQTDSPILFATDFARDGTHALAAVDDLHRLISEASGLFYLGCLGRSGDVQFVSSFSRQ